MRRKHGWRSSARPPTRRQRRPSELGAGCRRRHLVLQVALDYRGFRIEVTAQHIDGAWDVEVRIRRTLSEMKLHVEQVTCRKPTAKVAEERGLVYARRWVDRHAGRER